MFKDIVSNQEGQNLFPGIPTYIEGTPTGTPLTTENVKGPMIGVTADGAFNMYPGQQIGTLGKGILEIPLKQMGGSQQDMIMKLIMAFAQSRGQDPNEIMTKLKQLPQDQQQQAIQAIAQTMQEEMMQQQQQMQQQQMMQQPMGQQPMAKNGGCIDCQEVYPQAQNLNWFYKAQGGTAFPAANRYPESWVGYNGTAYAQGGMTEQYSGAQTYLPYDRPGETTPNFMVEYGGQTIDDIYQMMKKGGLNVDAKKKKGGELSQESFAKYLMKNGGYLPKHQTDAIVGVPNSILDGSIMDDYINTYDASGTTFPQGTTYDAATNTMISPEKFKEMYPNDNPSSLDNWARTSDKNWELLATRRDNDNTLYEQKLKYNNTPTVTPTTTTTTPTATTTQTQANPVVNSNESTTVQDNPYDFTEDKLKRLENRWKRQQEREANREARNQGKDARQTDIPMTSESKSAKSKSSKPMRKYPYYDYGVTMPEAAAIMGQSSRNPLLKKIAAGINIAGAFNTLVGDPLRMDRAYIGRNGGVLPKHQITGTTGTSWTPPAAFQGVNQFMPAPMQMETAEDMGWDAYNKSNPMASYENYLGANQTSTAAGDAVSFRPGSTADPANPNYQAPAGPESMGPKKRKQRGDIIGSMRAVNALGAAGSLLAEVEKEKELKKLRGKVNTTDRAFAVNKDIDRGDYLTNRGILQPDQYTYAQKNIGYTEQSPLYNQGKFGGSMPELRDGMEIDLDQYPEDVQREIIYSIYAAGGSVEYI